MKISLFVFFLLLFVCQYQPSIFSTLMMVVVMLLCIFRAIKTPPQKAVFFALLLIAILLISSFNSDFEYGIKRFNSLIYPVGVQDYLLILVAFSFSYFYLGERIQAAFNFIQLFSASSTILIAVSLFSWIRDSRYPVYQNSNWSGTVIIAFLTISAITGVIELRRSFHKRGIARKISLLKFLTIAISCFVNFYLLLSVASRSATISFLLFTTALIIFYELSLASFSSIPNFLSKSFRYPAYSILAAVVFMLIYQSRFYAKLVRFMSSPDPSNVLRGHIYKCYFEIFWEHPFLGNGLGKTAQICEARLSSITGKDASTPYVNHAHNFPLQIAADHGVLMLIIVCTLIFIYIKRFVKTFTRVIEANSYSSQDEIVLGIYMTVFSIGLASMAQSAIYHVPFLQIWTGLLIGISSAYTANQQTLVQQNLAENDKYKARYSASNEEL